MIRDAFIFFLCVKRAKVDLFSFTIGTWNVVVTVILLTYILSCFDFAAYDST